MATTLHRPQLNSVVHREATRASVLMQWHSLRRAVATFSATIALVVSLVLVWPMMFGIAIVTALVAVDAHLAIKTHRRGAALTLVFDITIAGVVCVLAGVPPIGVSMVTAYFVVLVAVLGRSSGAWPVGLYALAMGVFATSVPVLLDMAEPPIERTIAAGAMAVIVFGVATIEIVRRFVTSIRQRALREERRVKMSNAVAVASRALVAEDDARALAFALEAIREAIGAPIAFVEQNVEDAAEGLTAVVVESVTTSDTIHPTFTRDARTPWRSMPGARSHLEGGAPFLFRVAEASGTSFDRSGEGGARSEVNVPIVVNSTWVGVIGIADAESDRHWKHDELMLMRTLADLTAAFWQRVEDLRVRDSLIGSLDGRLRYEEALAKASTSLLGERGVGVDGALESIGIAARVDEVYITQTVHAPDDYPSARVTASWVQPGLVPAHPIDETTSYSTMPAVQEAIHQGMLARAMDGTNAELIIGIEVAGGWYGSVGFLRKRASRSWSKRDGAFLRTIADILGAYYERSESRIKLEALLTSKDQLIASVSHELRTPLTAVVGLAETLRENDVEIDSVERDQLIGVIAAESREMADLVEDLLIAARSGDGAVAVFPQRTDLSLLAASVASLLAVPESVDLAVDDTPSPAFADPVRVRQVIRNLLTNAMRYGGKQVRVTFGSGAGLTYLDVSDDGPGIPEHDLEMIFEPYGRSASSQVVPGSVGLGLTLSKRLAELMGGSLSYMPSEGCTFRLSVPSAAPKARAATQLSENGWLTPTR